MRPLPAPLTPRSVQKVLKRSSPLKSGGSEAEAVSDGAATDGDSVKIQMQAAREQHRRRLAKKGIQLEHHHTSPLLDIGRVELKYHL